MIDWARIARAMAHFGSAGFAPFDAAWHAPRGICMITCPDPERLYPFEEGVLVGSAEQSFMAALASGGLHPGRYVACTPCFRREPVTDETHHLYFMKVELFEAGPPNGDVAHDFARTAAAFMATETDRDIELVATDGGYDLEIGGVEVGSYSSRSADGMAWTCGTGIAEPRFGYATSRKAP